MVFQDGHAYVDPKGQFRATTVMDNLIHRGEMPITIGIFIDPGHKGALPEKRGWQPTPRNRSFEYDMLSDQYARFLLEEMLPEVSKQFHLTANPDDRAICGISSGGICAFTVAWERPDAFRKVLTSVGSYTNLRGGNVYPSLVRKTEPKPIRVYMADTSGDVDNIVWGTSSEEDNATWGNSGEDSPLFDDPSAPAENFDATVWENIFQDEPIVMPATEPAATSPEATATTTTTTTVVETTTGLLGGGL